MLIEFVRCRGSFGVGDRTDQINDGVCELLIAQGYARQVKDEAVAGAPVAAGPPAATPAPVAPSVPSRVKRRT